MTDRVPPIATLHLARSLPRLLALPVLFVLAGAAVAAVGVVTTTLPVAAAFVAIGALLAVVGLALATRLLTLRVEIEEASIRIHWIGGGREYRLVAGPVTRVRFHGENASRIRARTGIMGWQLGEARLRDEEEIQVVRLAPTASAILVPTEHGRVAIAPASEAELLDALTRAARARQRLDAIADQPPAPEESADAPEEPPEPPPPLTGIQRALLEERLAADRAAVEPGVPAVGEPELALEPAGPPTDAALPPPVVRPPSERAGAMRRPRPRRVAIRRPRPSALLVVLPLLAAGAAWAIGIATGRMPAPGTDIARLTTLALVLAGPATSIGAIMALAWWPRLVGVVVAGGLVASVLVGRVLLG